MFFMALSRSSRRAVRALTLAGTAAVAFAGVLFASKPAHAQRYYTYYQRSAPPPPVYYGRPAAPGYYGGPRPYYGEPPYLFQLGLDLEGVAPLNPPSVAGQTVLGGGIGFKVRAGEELNFPTGVHFTPEVLYAYDHLWAQDNLDNSYDWSMNRVTAGARLGIGRVIIPTVYAHIGYGWRQTAATYVTGENGGLAFDVGGALDFRLAPRFTFGGHLEYTQIALSTDTPQWFAVGGHIAFLF
ncbi:MAG: hypothetical protein ACRELB_04695 [Polyangiaceae bacterium]